jgi:hypothetical protein
VSLSDNLETDTGKLMVITWCNLNYNIEPCFSPHARRFTIAILIVMGMGYLLMRGSFFIVIQALYHLTCFGRLRIVPS